MSFESGSNDRFTLSICIAISGCVPVISVIALVNRVMTFVIGASSGKLFNFCRLDRL